MSKIQINISILENLALLYSVEEEKILTYLNLIRRAIREKYELTSNE